MLWKIHVRFGLNDYIFYVVLHPTCEKMLGNRKTYLVIACTQLKFALGNDIFLKYFYLIFFHAVCMGWFCPCILLCDVSQRMGEGCCFATCCPGALLGLRIKLRAQQNIQVCLLIFRITPRCNATLWHHAVTPRCNDMTMPSPYFPSQSVGRKRRNRR